MANQSLYSPIVWKCAEMTNNKLSQLAKTLKVENSVTGPQHILNIPIPIVPWLSVIRFTVEVPFHFTFRSISFAPNLYEIYMHIVKYIQTHARTGEKNEEENGNSLGKPSQFSFFLSSALFHIRIMIKQQ